VLCKIKRAYWHPVPPSRLLLLHHHPAPSCLAQRSPFLNAAILTTTQQLSDHATPHAHEQARAGQNRRLFYIRRGHCRRSSVVQHAKHRAPAPPRARLRQVPLAVRRRPQQHVEGAGQEHQSHGCGRCCFLCSPAQPVIDASFLESKETFNLPMRRLFLQIPSSFGLC
jgi:hypothetical protein